MSQNGKPLFGSQSNGIGASLGTPKLDPFLNNRNSPFDAVLPASKETVRKIQSIYENATAYIPPRHLEAPEGARTIDFKKVISVANGATVDLFSFTCKPGSTTVFYNYDIIVGTQIAGLVWTPTIDDRRTLQYHGDPSIPGTPITTANKILSVGYSEESTVCQILMEPGQIIKWSVTNNSGAAAVMGVRLCGYLDMSQRLTSTKFGD